MTVRGDRKVHFEFEEKSMALLRFYELDTPCVKFDGSTYSRGEKGAWPHIPGEV